MRFYDSGRFLIALGWGLLSQFSPFRYFPYFPLLSKQTLAIEYHVYIWQVLPQLSCGDTCQIWMWFRESNRYFRNIENFAYGEISERSFSNPHPRSCLTPERHEQHCARKKTVVSNSRRVLTWMLFIWHGVTVYNQPHSTFQCIHLHRTVLNWEFYNPVDTWHDNNAIITSKRRCNVVLT